MQLNTRSIANAMLSFVDANVKNVFQSKNETSCAFLNVLIRDSPLAGAAIGCPDEYVLSL